MSIYAKAFLAIYSAFIPWGSTRPVIVLTDNKTVKVFSEQDHAQRCGTNVISSYSSSLPKHTSPAAWKLPLNFCSDSTLIIINPKEKAQLLIRKDIQTSPTEVHIQSSNDAEEEQFNFLPDEGKSGGRTISGEKQRASKKALGSNTLARPGEEPNNNETNTENKIIVF